VRDGKILEALGYAKTPSVADLGQSNPATPGGSEKHT
jgi:hypothetical protein